MIEQNQEALKQAQKLLTRTGADRFEITLIEKKALKIEAKNQKTESLSVAGDTGLSFRLLKNKRLGFSFTTSLSPIAIEKAVASCLEIAENQIPDPHLDLLDFASQVYPNLDQVDQQGLNLSTEQKIEIALNLEKKAMSLDPRITAIRSAQFNQSQNSITLIDSSGEIIKQESTVFSAVLTCKAEENGHAEMGYDYGVSPHLSALDIDLISKNAVADATLLLGAKKAETMQCPAVFRNRVVSDLIGFLSDSFSAENRDKGRTLLLGKKGLKVFSEKLTLDDDGLLENAVGSIAFDGEGVPSKKTRLIDQGVFQTELSNLYTHQKLGIPLTGSSFRDLKSPPKISTRNLVLKKGRLNLEQLFEGIKKGIYITSVNGLHTANPITGDFSFGGSGILIENQKLTTPVRGFAITGNILDLLNQVSDVGSDFRFFGTTGCASFRVPVVSIGGV